MPNNSTTTKKKESSSPNKFYRAILTTPAGNMVFISMVRNDLARMGYAEASLTDDNSVQYKTADTPATIGYVLGEKSPDFEAKRKRFSCDPELPVISSEELTAIKKTEEIVSVKITALANLNFLMEIETCPKENPDEEPVEIKEEQKKPKEETVNTGIFGENEKEIQKRMKYIGERLKESKQKYPKSVVDKIAGAYARYMEKLLDGRNNTPLHEFNPNIYIDKGVIAGLIMALLAGDNILLVGPKATGKNKCLEQLGHLFELDVYVWSMNPQMDVSDLLWYKTLENGGSVKVKVSDFLNRIQEPCIVILDEVNLLPSALAPCLNSVFGYARNIRVPENGVVTAHPLTMFAGTMNEGYNGTAPLNEAFESRLHKFYLEYDPSVMEGVFKSKGLDAARASVMAKYYNVIYGAINNTESELLIENPEQLICPRAWVSATNYCILWGIEPMDAITECVINQMPEEDRGQLEEFLSQIKLGV